MTTHILTESIRQQERQRERRQARDLRECMRLDRERFHQETRDEWSSPATIARTWAAAALATLAATAIYTCFHLLP